MVQLNKKLITVAAITSVSNAQSLLTPITYESTLELFYYFQKSGVTANATFEGIVVDGNFGSTDDACNAIASGQIVYSKDGGEKILLTANCYDIFHLVDSEGVEISWASCEQFPFYSSLCLAGESSESTAALDSTVTQQTTATGVESSVSQSTSFYTSAYTVTSNGEVTTIESLIAYVPSSTAAPVSTSHDSTAYSTSVTETTSTLPIITAKPIGYSTEFYTITSGTFITTETSIIPIQGYCDIPQSVLAINTLYYEPSSLVSAQSASSGTAASTTLETTGASTVANDSNSPASKVSSTSAAISASAITDQIQSINSVTGQAVPTPSKSEVAETQDQTHTILAQSLTSESYSSAVSISTFQGNAGNTVCSISVIAIAVMAGFFV